MAAPRLGWFTALFLGAAFALDRPGHAAEGATGDVLTLLGEGKLTADLTAHGAYKLTVKLTNRTGAPLQVTFPPGLVADAFAQNQVLAQIQGTSPNPSQGTLPRPPDSGTQGMAVLESPGATVAADKPATLTIHTCCMNFGVPEPKASSRLFLKRVEDYSPTPEVHRALKAIAAEKLSPALAQAVIWHLANSLSWEALARQNLLGGGPAFTAQQVKEARAWLDRVLGDATGGTAAPAAAPAGAKPTRLCLTINPDPRGSPDSAALVARAVFHLQGSQPAFTASHGNFLVSPPSIGQPFVQWSVLVQTPPPTKKSGDVPVKCAFVRSEWDPVRRAWHHDPLTEAVAPVAVGNDGPQALARQILGEIVGRSVQMAWSGAGKKRKLTVVNQLPVALAGLAVRDARDPNPVTLTGSRVPAGGKADLELTEEQTKRLAAASRLVVAGFQVSE